MVSQADRDPRHHTQQMQTRPRETMDHLREDEPHLKATSETAAEVPGGLRKASSDYEQKNQSAWRG